MKNEFNPIMGRNGVVRALLAAPAPTVRLRQNGYSRLTHREFIAANGWRRYVETLLQGGRYGNWWLDKSARTREAEMEKLHKVCNS